VQESHRAEALLEALRRGDADLVLAPVTGEEERVELEELGADPFVLLVSRRDVLAGVDRPVLPDDLDGRDVVAKDCGSPSQRIAERALQAHGIAVTVRVRAHDSRTVHGLVAAGAGVALLPRLMVDPDDDATCVVPVGEWLPSRRIALLRPAGAELTPAAAVVEGAVRRAAAARLAAVGAPA
jgi:DNA-binding transcriptional LysR family regulator